MGRARIYNTEDTIPALDRELILDIANDESRQARTLPGQDGTSPKVDICQTQRCLNSRLGPGASTKAQESGVEDDLG
ncbi:hypothetical protein N7530_003621 [Penicillium desertorum]|uniref:Uncharacterized protein n=1 Tax=Penicillium desertorum TaxID=1303715 RepID=A0A9W9WX21_9EURO|nr:hypothetical protein N7530_003621 [Penicillium desertorum]